MIKKRMFRYFVGFILIVLMQSLVPMSTFAENEGSSTPSGIKFTDLEEEVDTFMANHIGVSTPGSAIAVVKDGKIVFSKGYGYADIENQVPVTAKTVFEYGSISKLFVWTSVMQLVEQEKIDLDADISTYLPDQFYQALDLEYPITMRNIMNHSSGFGEYPFDLIEASAPTNEMSLEQAILSAHPKQYYQPGSASSYSNYATALAGYVVESLSGEEFYLYEKGHIFDVLKMSDTAGNMQWKDNPSILSSKAKGYIANGKDGFIDAGWSYVPLYPAGSVNGTAEDLAKFAISLMPAQVGKAGVFEKDDTLSKLLTSSYDENSSGTAHGFFEYDAFSGQAFGHGGNTAAFSAQFAFVPEESFAVVVLTNAGGELDITMGLQDLLLGNSMNAIVLSQEEMPDAQDFSGKYVSMRRPEGTPLEFISYLSLPEIKAIDHDTITFSMAGLSGKYQQISPAHFKLVESSHPIFNSMFSELTFNSEGEGDSLRALFGKGQDFSKLAGNRNMSFLIANMITTIVAILFFIVMPIVYLIQGIKGRKEKGANKKGLAKPKLLLTLSGTALILINLIFVLSIIANPLVKYSSIIPFQVLNYCFSLLALVLMIWGLKNWQSETRRSQKTWFVLTIIFLTSFIGVLASWNMFVIFI